MDFGYLLDKDVYQTDAETTDREVTAGEELDGGWSGWGLCLAAQQ